jgi:glyoxylase-like metal-dependent hydrolase (beta-lactamase superfamily II)
VVARDRDAVSAMETAFTKGLHELGDGVFAYLQPTGTWGYSNAGLITGDGTSLLVDTLFDLRLTRDMLDEMRPITSTRPIDTLVNTHANGDHCYGNELVPDRAEIYATVAAAHEMQEFPAARLDALKHADDDEVRDFAQYAFGDFAFEEVSGRRPDRTFSGALSLSVGGCAVEVSDLGPAHTHSDSIVYVPRARTVFTGDLVFVEGTPIAWAGPVDNWLAACDRLCSLDVDVVVPGHGPVTDKEGVRAIHAYFSHVQAEAAARHAGGMDSISAAFDIDLGEFADWPDSERVVVTVNTIYRDLDPGQPPTDPLEMFRQMGRYHRTVVGARRS